MKLKIAIDRIPIFLQILSVFAKYKRYIALIAIF